MKKIVTIIGVILVLIVVFITNKSADKGKQNEQSMLNTERAKEKVVEDCRKKFSALEKQLSGAKGIFNDNEDVIREVKKQAQNLKCPEIQGEIDILVADCNSELIIK